MQSETNSKFTKLKSELRECWNSWQSAQARLGKISDREKFIKDREKLVKLFKHRMLLEALQRRLDAIVEFSLKSPAVLSDENFETYIMAITNSDATLERITIDLSRLKSEVEEL